MNGLLTDLRYSLRSLRTTPAFTAIVVLTLALGVGANTAVFSVFDQVLLRMLPVRDPDRLVLLDDPGAFPGRTQGNQTFSYPMYRDLRSMTAAFDGVIARFGAAATLVAGGRAEHLRAELVSGNYFGVLGLRPTLGRAFGPADDRVPGSHPVVMLSYGYWVSRFASSPTVLDRTVLVNGFPMTIVGVGPVGFRSVAKDYVPDVFVPLMMKAELTPSWDDLENRRSRWLTVFARLRDGLTVEQATAAANVGYRQLVNQELREFPRASARLQQLFQEKRLELLPGGHGRLENRQEARATFAVLLGLVGLILLIACTNIAGLLLARATARERHVAIRLSLGASRSRLVRQSLVESALLATAGGVAGLLVAGWTMPLLVSLLPAMAGSQVSADPDWRAAGFALAATVAAAALFGILPAMQGSRVAAVTLRESAGTTARASLRSRRALVIAQIALALLLVTASSLFVQTLYNLKALDPGFRTEGLLSFAVDPSLSGYDVPRARAVLDDLRRDLTALPGVRSAACTAFAPMTNSSWQSSVEIEGYRARPDDEPWASVDAVSPGYFTTVGLPLLAGRDFAEGDGLGAPAVGIVSESFALRYFQTSHGAVGHRVGFGRDAVTVEIVGVVPDGRFVNKRDKPDPMIYTPYTQHSDLGEMSFLVRTAGPPQRLAEAVRAAVRRRDLTLPVFRLNTVDAQVDETLASERLLASLSAAFGLLAVLLASLGLYGVIAYVVVRRTREIGIRMAIGADSTAVVGLVVRDAALLLLIGLAVGVALTVSSTRLLQAQLFGLSPLDPLALAVGVLMLAVAVLAAATAPARRAARIDPVQAMRTE